MLAYLHMRIAAKADNVVEVVCGIPCAVKGELPVNIVNYETMEPEISGQDSCHKEGLHVYVTGPMASGKRDYVLNTLGIPVAEAAFEVQEILRERPDLDVAVLAEKLSGYQAITQTEVGAGVIPLSASDREWREKAGRLACLLAARADIVVRMVCGVPIIVKNLR